MCVCVCVCACVRACVRVLPLCDLSMTLTVSVKHVHCHSVSLGVSGRPSLSPPLTSEGVTLTRVGLAHPQGPLNHNITLMTHTLMSTVLYTYPHITHTLYIYIYIYGNFLHNIIIFYLLSTIDPEYISTQRRHKYN